MSRTRELFAVTDIALEAHRAWADSEVSYLTDAFETAFDDLVVMFATGDIPAECRKLQRAVDDFNRVWEAWKTETANADVPTPQALPGNGVWAAIQQIEAARQQAEPRQIRQLEPIALLAQQGVTHEQIARMYGFVDHLGRAQPHKVVDELNNPGRHTGPGTGWISPIEKRIKAADDQRRRVTARIQQRISDRQQDERGPAPETWEDLLEQGISLQQIARMKQVSLEEARHMAQALGYDPPVDYAPPADLSSPAAARRAQEQYSPKGPKETAPAPAPKPAAAKKTTAKKPADPKPTPAKKKRGRPKGSTKKPATPPAPPSDDEFDQLETNIIECHRSNYDVESIVKVVSTDESPVSEDYVRDVINRYTENPAEFQLAETE